MKKFIISSIFIFFLNLVFFSFAIAGSCGPAHTVWQVGTAPSHNSFKCATGNPTQISYAQEDDGFGGLQTTSNWNCIGSTTVSCKAKGSSSSLWTGGCNSTVHGQVFTTTPLDSSLCTFGTLNSKTFVDHILKWKCGDRSCWAYQRVDGQCGTANGQSFTSPPKSNLCSSGHAINYGGAGMTNVNGVFPWFLEQTGTWTWRCQGQGGTVASCSANRTTPANHGKCGTSAGATFSSAPASNLCSQGVATTVVPGKVTSWPDVRGGWFWVCMGAEGNMSCYANENGKNNGVCGSAINSAYNTEPTTNLCSSGSPFFMNDAGGYYYWYCGNRDAGEAFSQCRSKEKTNVSTAGYSTYLNTHLSGHVFIGSLPAYGLCLTGTHQWDSTFGNETIYKCPSEACNSGSLGSVATETTLTCGTSNGGSFTSMPNSNLCLFGGSSQNQYSSPVVTYNNNQWVWLCASPAQAFNNPVYCSATKVNALDSEIISHNIPSSMHTGESKSVSITIKNTGTTTWNNDDNFKLGGVGDSSGQAALFGSTRFLIQSGVSIPTNSEYTFSFNITAPSTAAVYIPQYRMIQEGVDWFGAVQSTIINVYTDGACGSADGLSFSSAPTENLCSSGAASAIAGSGPWSWTCAGELGGLDDSCSADIQGTCGIAHNTPSYTEPLTEDRCDTGTPSTVLIVSNSYTWSCSGSNSTTNTDDSLCSALVRPACGVADGQAFETAPTTNLCNAGNVIQGNWLPDYHRRKPITISNTSGLEILDYQIKLSVTYDTDMKNDFSDLRFTDGDGFTQLNYWLESKVDSSSAIVWVKVPTIATTGRTIYMYYGNPSVISASNGENTFIFFDDFLGSSLDLSKWSTPLNSGISVSSGLLNIASGQTVSTQIMTNQSFDPSVAIRSRLQSRTYYTGIRLSNNTNLDTGINGSALGLVYYTNYESAIGSDWPSRASVSASTVGDIIPNPPTGYYIEDFVCVPGQKLKERRNDGSWNVSTRYNGHTISQPLSIRHYRGYGSMNMDWVLIRKAVNVEPLAEIGIEEDGITTLSGTGPWSWYCAVNGEFSSICEANQGGVCGSADGVSVYSLSSISPELCSSGTLSWVGLTDNSYYWSCGIDSCSAPQMIDGQCGVSDGGNFTSVPTGEFCSIGALTDFSGSGPWTWKCAGINSGLDDNCIANLVINGACGPAARTYSPSEVNFSGLLCSSGTADPVPDFPTKGWLVQWLCKGENEGSDIICEANRLNPPNPIWIER